MKFKRLEILSYKDTIRFHGHNGPFLALGYRLGKFLNRKLKPKGIMELKITVKTKIEKPYTCLIDGLQCSTFATLGKGNIAAKKSRSKNIVILIEKAKRCFTYKITEKAFGLCLGTENLDKKVKKIFRTPTNQLWEKA